MLIILEIYFDFVTFLQNNNIAEEIILIILAHVKKYIVMQVCETRRVNLIYNVLE